MGNKDNQITIRITDAQKAKLFKAITLYREQTNIDIFASQIVRKGMENECDRIIEEYEGKQAKFPKW